MKEKVSINEIDTFSFHDCLILDAKFTNTSLIIQLSHVDVLPSNSINSTLKPQKTNNAKIEIFDFNIKKIIENLPDTQNRTL